MRVFIIGAGPGDPKLLTVRAVELIASCPVVLYTGSLVPREVLAHARPDATVLDSAGMTLDEIVAVVVRDDLRRSQELVRAQGQQARITGPGADQVHEATILSRHVIPRRRASWPCDGDG